MMKDGQQEDKDNWKWSVEVLIGLWKLRNWKLDKQ